MYRNTPNNILLKIMKMYDAIQKSCHSKIVKNLMTQNYVKKRLVISKTLIVFGTTSGLR